MRYPWQQEQWLRLKRAQQLKRLSHALLFNGLSGTGKAEFANHFSKSLLCQQISSEGDGCQDCHSCRLISGRTHPNVLWIEPEKSGQAIKVDQVRYVSEFLSQSSLRDGARVVIIYPAEAMNANAANALLKTLEEPSAGALLILISNQPSHLPATILSRCQHITFHKPAHEQALAWLKENIKDGSVDAELLLRLGNGAPLAALQLIEANIIPLRSDLYQTLHTLSVDNNQPLNAAAKFQEMDSICFLDFLLTWSIDILRLQLSGNHQEIVNIDFRQELTAIQQKTTAKVNIQFMDYLQQLRAQLIAGINLNKLLMIESVLVRWKNLSCV